MNVVVMFVRKLKQIKVDEIRRINTEIVAVVA